MLFVGFLHLFHCPHCHPLGCRNRGGGTSISPTSNGPHSGPRRKGVFPCATARHISCCRSEVGHLWGVGVGGPGWVGTDLLQARPWFLGPLLVHEEAAQDPAKGSGRRVWPLGGGP